MNMGTCLPSKDCTNSGGTASGTCAKGFGVCCIGECVCLSFRRYTGSIIMTVPTCEKTVLYFPFGVSFSARGNQSSIVM